MTSNKSPLENFQLVTDDDINKYGPLGALVLARIRRRLNADDESGYCYERMSKIAKGLGMSDRTVRREITKLEEAGEIRREFRVGKVSHIFICQPIRVDLTPVRESGVKITDPCQSGRGTPARESERQETILKKLSSDPIEDDSSLENYPPEYRGKIPTKHLKTAREKASINIESYARTCWVNAESKKREAIEASDSDSEESRARFVWPDLSD